MMRLKIILLASLFTIAVPVEAGPEDPGAFETLNELIEWIKGLDESIPICVKPGTYDDARNNVQAISEFQNEIRDHLVDGEQTTGEFWFEEITTPVGNGVSVTINRRGSECNLLY